MNKRRPARAVVIAALLTVLLGTLCGPARAQEDAARRQRLEAVILRISAATAAADRAAANPGAPAAAISCTALFEGLEDADWRSSWSLLAMSIWTHKVHCPELESGAWARKALSLAAVQQAWQPVLAHFAAMPPAERLAENRELWVHFTYWYTLRHFGHGAKADELEQQTVQHWLDQLAAHPEDAQAQQALLQITRWLYGERARADTVQRLHQLFIQRLGPGHLHSLSVLRARIYYQRRLGRPAQALALSDELVGLLARHQPPNAPGAVRMAMMNRSERVGALSGVGRFADALDEGQVLLGWLQQQSPVPYGNIMRSAYNLAALCIALADYDEAARFAQLAIDQGLQAPELGDRHETWFPAVLLAHARLLRGDADAPAALEAALQKMPPHELGVAPALFDLARVSHRSGLNQLQARAEGLLDHLLAQNTTVLQAQRAQPLLLAAEAAEATGLGSEPALAAASQAVAYGLVGRDAPLVVQSHFALARHVAALQVPGALWLYKRGAQALQALRQGLPEAAEGTRGAYAQAYESDLRAFVGLLIDSGRLAEAEQALDVLRGEELYEFRRRSRGAAATARTSADGLSFTPDEQQRNATLAPAVQVLQAEARMADQRADQQASIRERAQLQEPTAQAALAQAAQAVREGALQASPNQAAATAGGAAAQAPSKVPTKAPALAPGVARISYFVRAHTIEAVWQTGARRQRISLPSSTTDINRAVQALRADLQRPGAGVPASAQQLHRMLVAPLAPGLAGIRHLHIVPDGALRYVPFAALHDGQRYLVQRFSVSTGLGRAFSAPEVARAPTVLPITAGPRKPAPVASTRLVAFGRTEGDERHSALPGVRQELAVLGALRGARVARALDTDFTAASLSLALASGPQVVHLASHFVLDAAGEEASYLLLGDGARLPLRALRELPWAGVQLALLSACDTGLALDTGTGSTVAQGRELAGFAATLQAAGVRNVLATLWRVDDASTAQWMQAFYAPWRSGGSQAAFSAQHLARTQRKWLHQHAGTAQAHPHHWAAFSWMGAAP